MVAAQRRACASLLCLLLVLSGCRPSDESSPAPERSAGNDRVAGWTGDLDHLLRDMEAIHPDLYHGVREPEVVRRLDELRTSLQDLSDDAVMVGLMRIVGRISADGRDGHTGIFVWGTGTYPVHSLPMRIWLFEQGAFVVDALPPYEGLVGRRITSVEGHPIDDLLSELTPLIARDNSWTVRLVAPRLLLIPEVLHGLGLVEEVDEIELQFSDGDVVGVEPISIDRYNGWAGPYGLHLPPRRGPLYMTRTRQPFWFTLLDHDAVYVGYNRVEALDPRDLSRLERLARGADKIVVDLRHNFGGETNEDRPLLAVLRSLTKGGSRRLFVITGRNTFSAASLFAARADRLTRAVFVGEPMGGSPDLYGNPEEVSLDYSGLVVTVASQFFVGSTRDDPRLTIMPTIRAPITAEDYFKGMDPALEAILGTAR